MELTADRLQDAIFYVDAHGRGVHAEFDEMLDQAAAAYLENLEGHTCIAHTAEPTAPAIAWSGEATDRVNRLLDEMGASDDSPGYCCELLFADGGRITAFIEGSATDDNGFYGLSYRVGTDHFGAWEPVGEPVVKNFLDIRRIYIY